MMTSHLTEEERHALAEGSVGAERRRELEAHLSHCAECADDVRRLAGVVDAIRGTARPSINPDDLWPGVRSRIDAAKVVPLSPAGLTERRRHVTRWSIAALAAAAILALVVPAIRHRGGQLAVNEAPSGPFANVGDSVETYRAEAQMLLNQFELQRAIMRPEAAATIDHDLEAIDAAIGELQIAIASDPHNAALRQLLASSYRQKVDLLRRAGNAS